jgi:signal peptidase I
MAEPAHGHVRRKERGEVAGLLRELPILIVVALGLALLIKTFLVQAFFIPSDSMENTLQRGDRVLVNKLSARFGEIERGQVVVFRDPDDWLNAPLVPQPRNAVVGALKKVFVFVGLLPSDSDQDLIKRVIGIPGDRVKCCDGKGRITINDVPLDEPYLYPGNPPSNSSFDVKVPPGRIWVMGDHRGVSADSRAHMDEEGGGTVPLDNVVGRAFVIVWPASRWDNLPVPPTFDTRNLQGAAGGLPLTLGFAGAVPAVLVLRRFRVARAERRARD